VARENREPRSRLASLVLFGTPAALLLAIALGLVIHDARASGFFERFTSAQDESPPDWAAEYDDVYPTLTPRPDLEGLSLNEVTVANPGKDVVIFGSLDHAARIDEAAPESHETVLKAAEATDMGFATDVIMVTVEPSLLATEMARTSPWWFPGHPQAVRLEGATPCLECHPEAQCHLCHVRRAKLYMED